MRKLFSGLACGSMICAAVLIFASCGESRKKAAYFDAEKEVIPPATLQSPSPMANEKTVNNARRASTDAEDVKEYFAVKYDASSETFAYEKYRRGDQSTWNCHDPKLFQDPDTGKYYVYSTGWNEGAALRSSDDLVHWAKHGNSALWDPNDVSLSYRHMHWDNDFLKWVGYVTNDGTAYQTNNYKPKSIPSSWAPTVVKQNGKYYMLHGIITDSLTLGGGVHPAAAITLAVSDKPEGPFIPASEYDPSLYSNSTLVRYVWTNKNSQNTEVGYWGSYNSGKGNWNNGFGAIDPEFVIDMATGGLVKFRIGNNDCFGVTYGSWKGGIALVYVDAETFKPVASVPGTSTFNGRGYHTGDELDCPLDSIENNQGTLVAGGHGAAYEGAQLIYNSENGYYYIFVSMGDLTFEYRVGVGRSKNVEGPYVDTSGKNMVFESASEASAYHAVGGKIIGAVQLKDEYGFMSPGGQSIFRDRSGKILFANHTRTNFRGTDQFCLQIHQMFFTKDGWPVLNQNEYWNDFNGKDEVLEKLSKTDVAGTYDSVMTVRSAKKGSFKTGVVKVSGMHYDDAKPADSKEIVLTEDGKIEGAYTGSWKLACDGYTVTISIKDGDGFSGTFTGYVLRAYDWARKEKDSGRYTITFTTVDGKNSGEYFWGNKKGR